MNNNGHVIPPAFSSPNNPYYATSGGTLYNPTIKRPTIITPMTLQGVESEGSLAVPAIINVPGTNHADPDYVGAIALRPGGNVDASGGANGLVIRAGTGPSTIIDVGTDGEGPNLLFIAGASGESLVYDQKYNPPVSLKPITLTNVSPTNIVDISNNGEIFRCVQAGVLASGTAAIGARFQVPRSGWYTVAIEINMANAPAPAPVSIQLAEGTSGGFDVGSTLTFAFTGPVPANTNTPYGVLDVNTMDFAQSQIATQGDGPVRQYTFMQAFESTEVYSFTLRSSNTLIDIGPAGQIKAELIAMC